MDTITSLLEVAPFERMSLKTRSAAIKCCQAQYIPHDATTPLGQIVVEAPTTEILQRGYYVSLTLMEILDPFRPFIISPLYSQVILDAIRAAKMTERQIREAFEDSATKEISGCEDQEVPINWNFDAFFIRGCQYQSVLPDYIDPNPYANLRILNYLEQWRRSTSEKLHYPKSSNKSLAANTFDELEYSIHSLFTNSKLESQRDWIYSYFKTGIILDGTSELRQTWYPANHKPRTYYAAGGTAYSSSLYLQSAFQSLTDYPPYTNKFLRVNPSRLRLNGGQYLRIYDFESFSTRLSSLRPFLHHLALFYCQCVETFTYGQSSSTPLKNLCVTIPIVG